MTLVALDMERVKGLLAAHGLRQDELDDAGQIAWERLRSMFDTFRGDSEGEYRAAMRKCIEFVYKDWIRDQSGHRKRVKGSVDEVFTDDEGEGRGRFDSVIARKETERAREEEAEEEEAEAERERRRRVIEAIKLIPNERRRLVVQRTFEGRSVADIQAEMNESRDNVYQLRTRGMKDLRDILAGQDLSRNGDRPDAEDDD